MSRPSPLAAVAAVLLVLLVAPPAEAQTSATQPAQPASGPGGKGYPHAGYDVIAGGKGADAWFLFLPTQPRPASAPLAVVTHGYYEYAGNDMNSAIARHTAMQGNVVIYPRWQTDIATPCPGPFDIEPCMKSEVAGIKGALAHLAANPQLPQAQTERTSYFGFSFGGIITANLASRWKQLGVPEPRAVWLDDPHDGGLTGFDEPALDDSLPGIPATAKVVCHSSADGVTGEDQQADGSCNQVFPRLVNVPAANKSLVLTNVDGHGTPALQAPHGVCAGAADGKSGSFGVDAYDWGFCWRSWDALRSCATSGALCEYALGDTPQNRHIGTWSDGTPIVGLKIQDAAPIRARPVPDRAVAPPEPTTTANRRPSGALRTVVRRKGQVTQLRGTASDDTGVARVEVAVVRSARGRCTQLTRKAAFVRTSCAKPTAFLKATGTRSWRLVLPRALRTGSYRILVRVTDTAGAQAVSPRRTVRAG